ncbi:GNAT family N-acetyltransferase [Oxalobacter vibrioformis]|uniref:GNAT family N-acetyltransferase n=1 Tax=Oxalobacter vibrioformis TaxID=933080 RepID=A0A9E9P4I0_9BURK|nr:N-acetyltransferase [Oxalobacter vibrioformis]WAW11113.1 GNAT family N-acetyltransferase [Oxalobacter vibrioformis]
MNLETKKFKDIDLGDPFFDSLKNDYKEFSDWFARKADESAYTFRGNSGDLDGFLYLKIEDGPVTDVTPILTDALRIKVGTMKINPHGTRLGERFVKKIFDHALHTNVKEIYVTVFSHHKALVALYERYGFRQQAEKPSQNGTELVLVRDMRREYIDMLSSYPLVQLDGNRNFLLSIKPKWHTRLLPDSILKTEGSDVVQDVSHTNSIHKVYLTAMSGVENLREGDALLIYRTSDGQGPARYRSVATSICVVEEYRHINSFVSRDDFLNYCRPYSVFSEDELSTFWNRKRYPYIIRFTYNIALKRRVTRSEMLDDVGLDEDAYWGFMPLSNEQFLNIIRRGQVDEGLIINKA